MDEIFLIGWIVPWDGIQGTMSFFSLELLEWHFRFGARKAGRRPKRGRALYAGYLPGMGRTGERNGSHIG